ncbi:MAG: cytochrome c biogenesis protein ResB [Candidatus Krumholzibacteriales bacterium]
MAESNNNNIANNGWRIISMKTAAVVIALLLIASTMGWISTEIFPGNVPMQEEFFRDRWGDNGYRAVTFLRLYDPFHSFWYRSVLALFFITLLACILTGWQGYLKKSFTVPEPSEPGKGADKRNRIEISWSSLARSNLDKDDITGHYAREHGTPFRVDEDFLPELYRRAARFLGRKRYALRSSEKDGKILFSARGGRWHYPGSFVFHIGLLVITIGGMIGSFQGKSELVYGKKGDSVPLFGSADSIRIDEFRIVRTEEGAVSDYLTFIRLPGQAGEKGVRKVVEVNHPVSYKGYDIYQSAYYVAEDELSWVRLACRRGDQTEAFNAAMGDEVKLKKWDWTVRVLEYLPDFRMGPEGAYSEGRRMRNPAVRLEVSGDFGTGRGWAFAGDRAMHSTLDIPAGFSIIYIEPVFYTGLEISRSPHAPVIVAGIGLSVLGLILLFGTRYHLLRGRLDTGGLVITGRDFRAGGIREGLEERLRDIIKAYREGGIHGTGS